MKGFKLTFFRLQTLFLERSIDKNFWKKSQMFPQVASIDGVSFKFFHCFHSESENKNEIARIPDF